MIKCKLIFIYPHPTQPIQINVTLFYTIYLDVIANLPIQNYR